MILQSGVLGVGAYLVIEQEVTAGVMIAASILSARALAPVELAIANWKGFVARAPELAPAVGALADVAARAAEMSLPRAGAQSRA